MECNGRWPTGRVGYGAFLLSSYFCTGCQAVKVMLDYHCFNRGPSHREEDFRVESVGMRRLAAIVGSALFLVIAPGTIAGLVPWRISRWRVQSSLLALPPLRAIGVLLVFAGSFMLMDCFARFALKGLGTPAPVFPPRHLVVNGLYRFVRNPMYVAVVSVIIGQGFFFGNLPVLEYGIVVWFCFHLFVLGYEEPTLRATFGAEYEDFCAHIPRWIPRLRPWPGRSA